MAAQKAARRTRKSAVLNIIYFVDAAKTRSFKLRIGIVNTVLAVLAVMLTWSVVSFFVLYDLYATRSDVRDRFSEALTTLFNYQIRFDGVFESAYPTSEPADRSSEQNTTVNQPSRNAQESTPMQATNTQEKVGGPSDALQKSLAEATIAPQNEALTAAQPLPNPPLIADEQIAVKNQEIIQRAGDKMELRFELHNLNRESRAHGVVWGVATFANAQGERLAVVSPERVGLNRKTGKVLQPTRAERFSIQRFRSIDLSFRVPDPETFRLVELEVSVGDVKKPSEHTLTHNVDVPDIAPTAAEETIP